MSTITDPLVSVVIPTYNYGRYVAAAVDSALGQTFRDLEVVVVDDGSTDDTGERLAPYAGRIRYIRQANQGHSAARNTGIRAARGGLIAFLDSDDLWHPRKLEVQVAYLSAHPEVGLLASAGQRVLPDPWPDLPDPRAIVARSVTSRQLVARSRFITSGVVIRAECFRRVGLFDPDLGSVEDRDMWVRIARHYPAVRMEVPLWWWRPHTGSATTKVQRMEENRIKFLRKTFAADAELRRDWALRLQAHSHAARTSAYAYDAAGMHGRAVARVVRSLLLWPLPFPAEMAPMRLERLRMLAVMGVRLAGFRSDVAPGPQPASDPPGAGSPALSASS